MAERILLFVTEATKIEHFGGMGSKAMMRARATDFRYCSPFTDKIISLTNSDALGCVSVLTIGNELGMSESACWVSR